MQFIDLQQQYRLHQTEIDGRMRRVLEHGQFIMGPEIVELETALAQYVGAKPQFIKAAAVSRIWRTACNLMLFFSR